MGEIEANRSYVDSGRFWQIGSVNISSTTGNITTSGKIENVNDVVFSTKGNITAKKYIIANGSIKIETTVGEIQLGNPDDLPTLNDPTTVNASGKLTISAKGTIQSFNRLRGNSVKLLSTGGDVIITTIDAGSGGVDINAAGLFQARGYFVISDISQEINRSTDAELSQFLLARGISFTPGTIVRTEKPTPISIIARPFDKLPPGSLNAPIKIRYGDATRTLVDQTFEISSPQNDNNMKITNVKTVGRILIQGDNSSYYTGPAVSGKLLPNVDDPYITQVNGEFVPVNYQTFADGNKTLYRNETYSTTFPSDKFPINANGTVGALIVGYGSNTSLYGSVQTRAFPSNSEPKTVINSDPNSIPDSQQQIVQRQINPGTNSDACNTSNIIAVNPQTTNGTNRDSSGRIATSSPSGSNNGCTPANNDLEILKILYETPDFSQNKQLNFDNSHPKFLGISKRKYGN